MYKKQVDGCVTENKFNIKSYLGGSWSCFDFIVNLKFNCSFFLNSL